jgi:hypothetical protein
VARETIGFFTRGVDVAVGVGVSVGVAVSVGVCVTVGVWVCVGIAVGVRVSIAVAVLMGALVFVRVAVGGSGVGLCVPVGGTAVLVGSGVFTRPALSSDVHPASADNTTTATARMSRTSSPRI